MKSWTIDQAIFKINQLNIEMNAGGGAQMQNIQNPGMQQGMSSYNGTNSGLVLTQQQLQQLQQLQRQA